MYKIRPMRESDIKEVAEIEKETFSIPWSEKSLLEASESEDNIYLVCANDEEIVGYCGVWTSYGEGNITNVAVKKEKRHNGIGKMLMEAIEEYGVKKDISVYYLEVRKSNENAINLYKKAGYREIGIRKRFYEKPVEDAIIMTKIYRIQTKIEVND